MSGSARKTLHSTLSGSVTSVPKITDPSRATMEPNVRDRSVAERRCGYSFRLVADTRLFRTVKQPLAAIRHLFFDWLVTGQIVPANPASSVRGPKHSVKKGKRRCWNRVRRASSSTRSNPIRALIGLMVYAFARIGAALSMKVEERLQLAPPPLGSRSRKGGQRHEKPSHHNLEQYLLA